MALLILATVLVLGAIVAVGITIVRDWRTL